MIHARMMDKKTGGGPNGQLSLFDFVDGGL